MNPFSDRMMGTYYAFGALSGLDDNCEEFINNASENVTEVSKVVEADETLETAIKRGLCDKASKITIELLKTVEPMTIINDMIIPALDEIGQGFEHKTVFLPRLLMSADAAKASFAEIKRSMPENENQNGEKIIIATVKGDIHDIGKNIVKALLSNYGYDVIDLGKDVPPDVIAEAAKKHRARLVALSAMMTTTVGAMEETIKMLSDVDCKVLVGGAVLTADYAKQIGADYYAKDAMESVRCAEQFFKNN